MSILHDLAASADGRDALRILCGAFLVPHLFVKFRNQDFVKQFMAQAGLRPPAAWLYAALAIELAASAGLLLDILTVYAAMVAAAFLGVAAWASWNVSGRKWMWNFGGAEYPAFWAAACLIVASNAAV